MTKYIAAVILALALVAVGATEHPQTDSLRFRAEIVDNTHGPCADFYAYACTTWMKTHPIPSDRSSWDPYYELEQKNDEAVRRILEGKEGDNSVSERKVRDYYAACMDEASVEKHGLTELRSELDRIDHLRSPADAVRGLAELHKLGSSALFSFYPDQDLKDARQVIAVIDVGSLGMTDRSYYVNDDLHSRDLREKYVQHVATMLELSGLEHSRTRAGGEAVLRIETQIARYQPSRELQRDPRTRYHKLSLAALRDLTPSWSWDDYFHALGAPPIPMVNVTYPDYLKPIIALWTNLSLDEQKAYLRWQLLHALATALPEKFVEENFRFYGEALRGAHEMQPRWKRCANLANTHLGEAIGRIFVSSHFSLADKQRVLEIIRSIQAALRDDLATATWMSEATRRAALAKLSAYRIKVGYPDRWRDYSRLEVHRDEALGNALRGYRFEFARQLRKIGKPVDRDEWFSLPQEVDGYQSSNLVEIVFTAGLLQPPFFDPEMDDAVNFGSIGRAIGHEFTHGFDDHGRQFDANGNLNDWWTMQDSVAFTERAECFVDEYSGFSVLDQKLNGRLTLGENIADNGGIRLAYLALEKFLEGKPRKLIDGFTPEQRFFLAFAETQCVNTREQTARNRLLTDPHSPGQWRVNGTVTNMPEFKQAFGCKTGEAMISAKPCRLW